MKAPSGAVPVVRRAAPWLWGTFVAGWLCRFFFALGPGEIWINHEGYSYAWRVIEFQDLLRAGYLFPHWAVDFRSGLGSPYFGYYQPGFFYLASALAFVVPIPTAIATTVWVLAFVGYGGMLALVRARFGVAAGVLAGTSLLLSPYIFTELYLRGDLSEFTGMMLLPPMFHWLTAWLDGGRPAHWRAMGAGAAGLICAHPVSGLFGYGALVVVLACWVAMGCDRRRAAAALGALGVGIGLAAFYLMPVALEWSLVSGNRLTKEEIPLDFIDVAELLGLRPRPRFLDVPVALGTPVLGLAGLAIGIAVWRWRRRTVAQRRLLVAMLVLVAGTTWLMHASSQVLWDALPLLRFAQFPWRGLLVLTVALGALTGCLVEGSRVLAVLGILLLGTSVYDFYTLPVRAWTHPATARGLAAEFVAPDVAHEWLPRDAFSLKGRRVLTTPLCTGQCSVAGFRRDTGRLHARVTIVGPSTLILPHYYFPVGWTATFDGEVVPLERTDLGLMQITLGEPGSAVRSGDLDLRFGTTPARRLGVAVSGTVLLLVVVGAVARTRAVSRS